MALDAVLTWHSERNEGRLGGCIACSSSILPECEAQAVYDERINCPTPILITQGDADRIVPLYETKKCVAYLKSFLTDPAVVDFRVFHKGHDFMSLEEETVCVFGFLGKHFGISDFE